MAVATLWMVTVGGEVDEHPPDNLSDQLPPDHVANTRERPLMRTRQISCFLQGLVTILADLLNVKPIFLRGLFRRPWPTSRAVSLNSS